MTDGLDRCDAPVLNHGLCRTLHDRGGYVYPIDPVAQRLAARASTSAGPSPIAGESPPNRWRSVDAHRLASSSTVSAKSSQIDRRR